jgi:hypothetical protein
MDRPRRAVTIPVLFVGVLLAALLLTVATVAPPDARAGLSPVGLPENYVKVEKLLDSPTPAQPGGLVRFIVKVTLGRDRDGLSLVDTLSNAGNDPATRFSATALHDLVDVVSGSLVAGEQSNGRVVFRYDVGSLEGGEEHEFSYSVQLSPNLGCRSQATNGVALRQAGVNGAIGTATPVSFSIRCAGTTPGGVE